MEQKCRIVIVEDHAIVREGLRSLLSTIKDFDVIGEAENGREGIYRIKELKPDLVLTDLSMPRMDGIDMIDTIKRELPGTKVIALTVHRGEEYFIATLKAGADGYVLKEARSDELLMAIKEVLKGKRYLSPEISGKVIEGYLDGRKTYRVQSVFDRLTKREREVMKMIAEGNKNQQIADQLSISVNTVEKHRSNIMEKLNIHSMAGLIALALEKGFTARH